VEAKQSSPAADEALQQCSNATNEQYRSHYLTHGNPVMSNTQHGRYDERKHQQATQYRYVVLCRYMHTQSY